MFWKKKPPPVRRTDLPFAVRDQTRLAIFYGRLLGVDTHKTPELTSADSLTDDQRRRWMAGEPRYDWKEWGVFSIGYLSAHVPIEAAALIHVPSVVGAWDFDNGWADVSSQWTVDLSEAPRQPPALSEASRQELAALAEQLGPELLEPLSWTAVALVNLRHV